jgi:hypothetical protein
MSITEMWSYDKDARFDRKGKRWHFVRRDINTNQPYEEQPFEVYFRNDSRTEFGVLKFKRRKDNPYRDYLAMINKVMNETEFRKSLLERDKNCVATELEMNNVTEQALGRIRHEHASG